MRVFSTSIEVFLKKLTLYSREILIREFGVPVARTRFRTRDGWTWPLAIVAIDDRDRLGYFDSEDYTIGINKCLMYTAKERVIKDLLRHELAHYFTHIEFRAMTSPMTAHGPAFQSICDKYHLPANVHSASMDIRAENDAIEGELASEEVIAKIQKLMSLAASDNENEAALATLRANELMVKYNLDTIAAAGAAGGELEYCVKLVLPSKRSTPRLAAIARILREFFVYPITTKDGLEVTGTWANVDNAEYIATYLDRELAAIWTRARKKKPGMKQKSFMSALATSYTNKLRASRYDLPDCDKRALVRMSEALDWAVSGVYGGSLRSASSRHQMCPESASQGAQAGSNLEIRRGMTSQGGVKLIGDGSR
jgi:hypothetical protein